VFLSRLYEEVPWNEQAQVEHRQKLKLLGQFLASQYNTLVWNSVKDWE